MARPLFLLPFLLLQILLGQPAGTCPCELRQGELSPAKLEARQCSLTNEAEKQPADVSYFFLKDVNPRKANRLLILPRKYTGGMMELKDMTASQRTELWTATINKAKELWGDDWGVATNGAKVRTQCHLHIHIGKMIKGLEKNGRFIVVNSAAQIPVPADGTGLWIHPQNGKLVVHVGEQAAETVLLR